MARVKSLLLSATIFVISASSATWAQTPPQAAQVREPDPVPAATPTTGHEDGQSAAPRPVLEQRYPRYKVQREDVLSLSFPLSPEFNQTVTVQPDGYVSLYGGPNVHIQGMTVPEVAEAIKKAYAGTLHDPIVDIDLQDFQRPYFTVSGQVGKPGQYDLRHDTTIAEAIGIAGGFTPQAKTQVFFFHRVSPGWFEVKQLKLNDVLNGKKVNEDASLGPGDMIFVPEKFITKFRKYVPYAIGIGTGITVPY
jgi:polysaccharide biosynthesis/export protein